MSDSPSLGLPKFTCPHCGTVAQQNWFGMGETGGALNRLINHFYLEYRGNVADYIQEEISKFLNHLNKQLPKALERLVPNTFALATCQACGEASFWKGAEMIYPLQDHEIAAPNEDLSNEIQNLYLEAASIRRASPKGACAILRLALQKLLIQLGKDGKNINDDIGALVADGLSSKIQKALDLLRVVGNNAVHPGTIDFDDNDEIAEKMFLVLNLIAEELVTHPKDIEDLYENLIPESTQTSIRNRDGNGT